jgi:predicted amidohydrolase
MLQAEQLIASQPGADLYVLPEMWSTGFATKPAGVAHEEEANEALAWMQQTAHERHCAICGSLTIRTVNGNYRNRQYFVNGKNGTVQYYDKHHLFTYGGENHYYKAGETHTIVEYEGFRILLLTCYDLRFPIWSRYSYDLQYDLIVCVANWPESRQNAFHILTRARAIENMTYLIAVNRVGDDDYSHYRGCSCILSPLGKTLVQCKPDMPQAVSFSLNLETLRQKRAKFKVLEDRDIW